MTGQYSIPSIARCCRVGVLYLWCSRKSRNDLRNGTWCMHKIPQLPWICSKVCGYQSRKGGMKQKFLDRRPPFCDLNIGWDKEDTFTYPKQVSSAFIWHSDLHLHMNHPTAVLLKRAIAVLPAEALIFFPKLGRGGGGKRHQTCQWKINLCLFFPLLIFPPRKQGKSVSHM